MKVSLDLRKDLVLSSISKGSQRLRVMVSKELPDIVDDRSYSYNCDAGKGKLAIL